MALARAQVATPILEAALPLLAKLRRPQLLLDRRRPVLSRQDGMRMRIWILPAISNHIYVYTVYVIKYIML